MKTRLDARAGAQSGIALILVLWVTTLLMVVAGSFAYATRTDMNILGGSVQRARAEAVADAGIHRAALELFPFGNMAARWKADGTWHEFPVGDGKVRVSLLDESAKIDINTAVPRLIKGMLMLAGLDDFQAEKLSDAIQDWRDADLLTRPNGAEAPQYREAGLSHQPSNAPFQAIQEIRLVLGMTDDIYRRIQPMITIFSRQPGVNHAVADREVLLAIPGVTATQVDEYIGQREAARAANQPIPAFAAGALFGGVASATAVRVRSIAEMNDGSKFVREAVLRGVPDIARPFAALTWEEGKLPEPGKPEQATE